MHLVRICAITLIASLVGCATPPEVKQALVSLDNGYADNLKMMQQYRELVAQINEREQTWSKYLDARNILASALTWATTDPPPVYRPDAHAMLLGARLVSIVNCIRLNGLPEKKGENGVVFAASGAECRDEELRSELQDRAGKMTGVIQALPWMVAAVNERVDERARNTDELTKSNNLQGFDDYRTNVQALRTINSAIKRYLDIDVTIKPDDLNEIANSIRQLNR